MESAKRAALRLRRCSTPRCCCRRSLLRGQQGHRSTSSSRRWTIPVRRLRQGEEPLQGSSTHVQPGVKAYKNERKSVVKATALVAEMQQLLRGPLSRVQWILRWSLELARKFAVFNTRGMVFATGRIRTWPRPIQSLPEHSARGVAESPSAASIWKCIKDFVKPRRYFLPIPGELARCAGWSRSGV